MVFNATFNNILVISWQSVLLVEETNDLLQVTDKFDDNVVSSTPRLSYIVYVCNKHPVFSNCEIIKLDLFPIHCNQEEVCGCFFMIA